MNSLQTLATFFTQFFRKEYVVKAGRKGKTLELKLIFKAEHFHHLIGLQKLTDLPNICKDRQSFHKIINGVLTYDSIKSSKFISEVDERIRNFTQIGNIVGNLSAGNIVLKFSPDKAHTRINADVLMYEHLSATGEYIHLLFTKQFSDKDIYVPMSFFSRSDTKYIERQERYTVLEVEINFL